MEPSFSFFAFVLRLLFSTHSTINGHRPITDLPRENLPKLIKVCALRF
jgi:hypothetical protein